MEAMEDTKDKVSAVLALCERLCPKWGFLKIDEGIFFGESGDKFYLQIHVDGNRVEHFYLPKDGECSDAMVGFFSRLLSLGVQSPIQKPSKDEIYAAIQTAWGRYNNDLGDDWLAFRDAMQDAIDGLFSNAPSVGKDRTNEAIKVCADFAEAVVSSLKEKHKEGVAKLIGALERAKYACEFGNQSLGCIKLPNGAGYTAVPESAYDVICIALAAYKGKEAKEGGGNG